MKTNRNWMKRAAMLSAMAACVLNCFADGNLRPISCTAYTSTTDVDMRRRQILSDSGNGVRKTYIYYGLSSSNSGNTNTTRIFVDDPLDIVVDSAKIVISLVWSDIDSPDFVPRPDTPAVSFNGVSIGCLTKLNSKTQDDEFIIDPSLIRYNDYNVLWHETSVNNAGSGRWARVIVEGVCKEIVLSASDGTVPGGIEVNWTDNVGSEQYELFRGEAKDGPFNRIAVVSTNAYFDSSVEWGRPYWYYVNRVSGQKGVTAKDGNQHRDSETDDGTRGLDSKLPMITDVDVGELWLTGEGPYYCFLTWNDFDKERYYVSSISFDLIRTDSGKSVWTSVPKKILSDGDQLEVFDVSLDNTKLVPRGKHGQHKLKVTWEVKDKVTGAIIKDGVTREKLCDDVKVFFHKYEKDDGTPNWFRYWPKNGAIVSESFGTGRTLKNDGLFRFNQELPASTRGLTLNPSPSLKKSRRVARNPSGTPPIYRLDGECDHQFSLGIDCPTESSFIKLSDRIKVGSNEVGVKKLAVTIAHEKKHAEIADQTFGDKGKKGWLFIGNGPYDDYKAYDFGRIEGLLSYLIAAGCNSSTSYYRDYYSAIEDAMNSGKYVTDFDGDGVADAEENEGGRYYDEWRFSSEDPDTYDFNVKYGYTPYSNYGDNEVLARSAEKNWQRYMGSENDDWAWPGYNVADRSFGLDGHRLRRTSDGKTYETISRREIMSFASSVWNSFKPYVTASAQKMNRRTKSDMSAIIQASQRRVAGFGVKSMAAKSEIIEVEDENSQGVLSWHESESLLPEVIVSTGDVYLVSCEEAGLLCDDDGRVASLRWSLVLTNATDSAISVKLRCHLADSATNALAWAATNVECAVGLTTLEMCFDAEDVFLWNTSRLMIYAVTIESSAGDMAWTISEQTPCILTAEEYSASDLANDKGRIVPSSVVVDVTGDGVMVSGEVVRISGDAAQIYASLTDTNGLTVTSAMIEAPGVGTNGFSIFFPGDELYRLAKPLPYAVESLRLVENGVKVYEINEAGTVNAEDARWFRPADLTIHALAGSGAWAEPLRGTDGLCSQITYSFAVSNTEEMVKACHARATLLGTNEEHVCSLNLPVALSAGSNSVSMSFSSIDMKAHEYDGGVYRIGNIFVESDDGNEIEVLHTDGNSIFVAKNELGGVPFTVKGAPQYREADGANPAAVVVTVDVERPDTITASALLVDGEGKYVATAMTSEMVGEVGERTLNLTFDPDEVNASGRRGPYTISYLLLKSGIEGVEDIRLEDFEVRNVGDSSLKVFVDAVNGDDANDGATSVTAKRTIGAAIDAAMDDDKIVVADGVYEPFTCTNRNIVIESVNGPRYTIIDGGGTNRCVTLGTSAGHTNTVLRGFTLRNGNASGNAVTYFRTYGGGVCCGTAEDCVLANNEARYGGGAYNSALRKCSIVGNRAGNATQAGSGGAIYWTAAGLSASACYIADNTAYNESAVYASSGARCLLTECLVVKNTALFESAIRCGTRHELTVANCTVADNNCTPSYRPGTYYVSSVDSILYFNYARPDNYNSSDSCYGSLTNCCTTVEGSTCIGTGIVTTPPSFIDREGRIYDLHSYSGDNIVGSGMVVDTNGMFKVGVEIDGCGVVTRPGAIVSPGDAIELTAEETGRAFEGFYTNGVFATLERTLVLNDIRSDIRVTAKFTKRTAYVAANGNDANDGLTAGTPKKTINAALPIVENGEAIEVAPGTYAPIAPSGYASKGKAIRIYSTHGASLTIIDGGGTNRCANFSDYYGGTTNMVLRGFTLINGHSTDAGGGAYYGELVDCLITDNVAATYGGGSYFSHLINCVVARNKTGAYGGGTYYGVADHCTICGNEAGALGGGTYYGTIYNCIVSKNVVGGSEANWSNGTFDSCCTYPNRGSNPIVGDPLLVDGWNGDARLRVGSPCVVDGVQVCGAYIGEPVEGVSVSVGVQGVGMVSNETILVTSGASATIEAVETVRPFLYWNINGEQIADRVYTLTNITSDIRAIAVFGSFDWYVDAEYGNDENDGSDWGAAKRTLQSAVAAAVDDETIYVEAGTYGPISTDNKRIRIESMNGAEMTFIDGGGASRCATLGSTSTHTNSALVGFTLLNGRAPLSGNYAYGGGSYYGTLECCVISNCVASGYYAYGGGAYYGYLNNCLVAYNCATSSSYQARGGGAYGSILRSCTVARNCAAGANAAYAGGTYGNSYSAYNTIIWGNEARAPNASNAYYPDSYYQSLYSCCTSSSSDRRYSGTITNDPQFVDVDAGNFHLTVGSPCLNTGYDWYVQGDMDLDWDDRIQGTSVDMGCYEGAEYAAPPGQVTGLVAVRGVLTWDAMPDAEGFMVYRSTRRAASSAKYIGMAGTNTYTDETAVEGTTYYYWVTAFNTLGMGTRSDVTENTWPEPLAIATTELSDGRVHDAYSVQLLATGGALPYEWEAVTPGYVVSSNASTFAATGTAMGWHGDDTVWWLDLPFDFPFYGKSYRGAHIDSNGGIVFEGNSSGPMIYVLRDDLVTDYDGCDVFVAANENSVTIRWKAVYYNSEEPVNASATLYADGRIVLSYGEGNANGGMCGISAGDGERYHIVGEDSDSWNNAMDITFETGGYEVSSIVLPDGITLSADGVLSGVAVESGTFTVYVRVTDDSGDSVVAEFPLAIEKNPITFYVDAANGDDANDGLTAESAKESIQAAMDDAFDDDVILVADGIYSPIYSPNRRIRIESVNGPGETFVDGGGTSRCATLSDRYYNSASLATNTVLVGFTLVNGMATGSYFAYGGGAYYGKLERCVISNCVALATEGNNGYDRAYGGAAYFGVLDNCLITGNRAESPYISHGGGTYCSILRNCTVVGNTALGGTTTQGNGAGYGGGSCSGAAYNSIVWGNETDSANSNVASVATYSSLTFGDPVFNDAANGDFRLAPGSPCLNAGDNAYVQGDEDLNGNARIIGSAVDLGCYEGAVYSALPGIVTDVRALRGVVTWTADLMSQEYEILRGATDDVSGAVVVATVYGTEWTDEDADSEHRYWYWVRGKNPLGAGAIGNAAQMLWPGPLVVVTESLPNATEMVEYSAQLEATGGVAPYSWSCPARGYTVSTNLTSTFTEIGTAQGWHADDSYWTLELPFDFPLYGNKYRTAYVNSNGMISFGSGISRTSYESSIFLSNPIIAALWKDLKTTGTSDVFVESDTASVTIRWKAVYYNGGSDVNASISLYPDGSIKFAYGSGNVNGGFVGVSAGDGENFIVIDGNYSSLDNAPDIVLKQSGLPGGFSLSDDGEITGTPMAAGTNTFTVTVTDALGDTDEKELTIVVNENPNHKPVIDAVSPMTNVYVKVGNSATFAVTAHDPEGAALEYAWYLDGDEIECSANRYTFAAMLDDAGAHTLECVVSDGLWTDMVRHKWSFRVIRDWYVDSSVEDDSGDGSSADSAISSISEAVWYAEDGDTIYVAPGTYEDYLEFYSDRTVSIVATGGASCTFFTGQIDGYSTQWYSGSTVIQSSMTGFTFRGCYLNGTTLHGCVLTSEEAGCYPSEAYGCRLFDCSVTGNTSDYSPIEQCELTRCTVAGNTVGEYGAVGYSSYVYDSIVWDNVTVNGETSNYDTETWYDEWWDDDAEGYVSEEYAEVHIFNSCTWPTPSGIAGTGNITIDPRLVDAVNGDLRLRVGSPCLVDGVQTMGVYLGDPVAGFVLSVRIEGVGAVSPMTAIVANGGTATFAVMDNVRPFLGFSTNGVFATAADTLTWQGVKSDGIVTAVFSNFTFYVDAATGDDANDGLSWATARASIQSAINDAVRGETIYVKAGTYYPIVVGAAMRLRIESVDGKEATIIDGGGERQCANLGGNDSFSSTLVGFTLTNGYSNYGGGATGGKLVDCDVIGNTATYRGGGLNYSTAIRCRIMDNVVSPQWRNDGYGGGAYGGTLINCLVISNVVDETSYYGYGGGTSQSYLCNCTVVGNEAHGTYYVYGGGVQSGGLYNTIVFGNSLVAEDEGAYTYGEDVHNCWYQYNCLIGEDPGFVDETNGDYRLAADSPCIDAGGNSYVMEDTDLDGNARIQHYTVDIGCYEYELATPERDADADFAAQMAGTCYGVFVGVGRYTYTSSLTGPTIDATNMQARCIAKGYWRDENTVAFLDAAATKAVVRAKLATLAAKAVSGDTVLYYQSSHGGNNYDQYGNMTKDTCICLHDATYEDYEMAEDLMQFAAGVKVVIVLDTCHSAGMFKAVKGTSPASTKSFALRVRELMSERAALRKGAKSGIATDDIGWIAAADYNQYSYDSPRGGAFTVAMLDGWKSGAADYDGDKRLNFHELWRYAKGIAVGYGGSDASDAQCLNENVLLSRFAGAPDSSGNGNTTETTPAPVEHVWLDSYPEVLATFGGDYEAMASAPSPGASGGGKTWPNGSPYYVWQDFVAGTSPTNDTVFTATIRMEGNTPVVTWEPDTPELRATRVYRTLGKKMLLDANWTDITDKDQSEYHFFRVTVDMP